MYSELKSPRPVTKVQPAQLGVGGEFDEALPGSGGVARQVVRGVRGAGRDPGDVGQADLPRSSLTTTVQE